MVLGEEECVLCPYFTGVLTEIATVLACLAPSLRLKFYCTFHSRYCVLVLLKLPATPMHHVHEHTSLAKLPNIAPLLSAKHPQELAIKGRALTELKSNFPFTISFPITGSGGTDMATGGGWLIGPGAAPTMEGDM